jgi:hypothetical protein
MASSKTDEAIAQLGMELASGLKTINFPDILALLITFSWSRRPGN